MKNIKLAKELVRIAKNLIAENNFQKLQHIKQRIKELNQELSSMIKRHQHDYDLMKEVLEYLKTTNDPQPEDKKAIRVLEQGKYHLFRREIIEKRNPELYEKIKWIFTQGMKNYPKEEASLKRKIEEYELSLKDLQHRLGNKLNLLNSKLPDDFENAMENLRQSCINYMQQDINLNIKNYNDLLNDENKLWMSYIEESAMNDIYYDMQKEERIKIKDCKTFDEFKSKIMNEQIKVKFSQVITKEEHIQRVINSLKNGLNKKRQKINEKLQYEQRRNADEQGNFWYQQQRLKLLGELSIYCDDIISAYGLHIARNGEFNVTVVSSNGTFRVLTSSVIGHHRYQGWTGLVWVRPHWRLTVRRVNG